jgi:hypothetical protein
MIFITFQQHWPLFVDCDSDAVVEAFLAKPSAAFLIIEIFCALLAASHTAKSILLQHIVLIPNEAILLKIMLPTARTISIDIHQLTGETVPLPAVLAPFRALLLLLAQLALRRLVQLIRVLQQITAGTVCIDIGDDLSRFRLVEHRRQLLETRLADTEITVVVVVDSVVADRSADPADIADAVEICYMLEIECVADWATLLRTRRHPAAHTVEFLANSTKGTA